MTGEQDIGASDSSAQARVPSPSFRQRASGLWQRLSRPPDLGILIVAIAVLSVALWWIQVQAYYSYNTFAQDLGAYNQAIYNTAYNHAFLYYTTQTQGKNTGALLSIHFSPILAILAPAYWIAPGPITLLLLKQLIVESAAIPLFLLVQNQLRSRAYAALFAASYLAAAPVMALTWTTFDPEIFLPLTVLGTLYFQARRHWVGFLCFLIAALCVIESAAPLIGAYFGVGLIGEYFWWPSSSTEPNKSLDRRFFLVGLIVCIAGFAVSWLDLNVIYDTGGGFGNAYARHFSVLGAQSIPDVPVRVVTHPGLAVEALGADISLKVLYVVLIFGTVGFLAVFARLRYLAPILGWLGIVFLSNVPGWFELGNQYAGYLVPFVFAGAVDGAPRMARLIVWLGNPAPSAQPNRARRIRRLAVLSVASCLIVGVVAVASVSSPLLANPVGASPNIAFGWNTISEQDRQLDSVIALIPPTSSVLTTSHLFPQVSGRLHAYLLPLGEVGFAPGLTFGGFVQQLVNRSQYILIDFQIDPVPAQTLLQYANFSGGISEFGVEAAVAGAYLLARGWAGSPVLWAPFDTIIQASDFSPEGSTTLAGSNLSQYPGTLYRPSGGTLGATMWMGPNALATGFGLPPGFYSATFHFYLKSTSSGTVARLRVTAAPVNFTAVPFIMNSAGTHYNVPFQVAGPSNRTTLVNWGVTLAEPTTGWSDQTVTQSFQFGNDEKLFISGVTDSTNMTSVLYGVTLTQLSASAVGP